MYNEGLPAAYFFDFVIHLIETFDDKVRAFPMTA